MKFLERCLAHLNEIYRTMPDPRTGKNIQYAMKDIGMAAFSVFFMQHPSFLSFQRSLHQHKGRDNTQTLFGMEKIPTDNHIRQMLDGVDPGHFEQAYFFIIDNMLAVTPRAARNVLGGRTLIALDGSEYFCSKSINCPACSKRMRNDGVEEFFHAFLGATIVTPASKMVFSLPPEFVSPQDGEAKQDCEWRAACRWLERVAPQCARYNPLYLGDDLYAKQEICAKILELGASFIFTCKDGSHKTLCEFRKGIPYGTYREVKGIGKQKREYRYRWVKGLPIRDRADTITVNWFEVVISKPGGSPTYRAAFITNLTPEPANIVEMASCARARWKIENENFNVLKNNGYHLEHNFGHGKRKLASVLVALNLLAFSLHQAADKVEELWQAARAAGGTRTRFFNIISSLVAYILFPDWKSLMWMIGNGRPPP